MTQERMEKIRPHVTSKSVARRVAIQTSKLSDGELEAFLHSSEELDHEQPAWQRDLAEQAETLSLFDESDGVVSDEDWAEHLAPTDRNIRGRLRI